MDEIELHEKLDTIETYLQKHAIRPERPFWLVEDTGEDYCFDCIKAMFDTLEYGENYDGGFDCEGDNPRRCEKCGKILQYSLTGYGTENELSYFVEEGADFTNPNECYELSVIADSLWTDEQKTQFVELCATLLNSTAGNERTEARPDECS